MNENAPAPAVVERRVGVSPERLLHDWRAAHERALAYLAALGVPDDTRGALATSAVGRALEEPWEPGSDAIAETLRALRALLREGEEIADDDGFLAWRLDGALAGRAPWSALRGRPTSTPVRGRAERGQVRHGALVRLLPVLEQPLGRHVEPTPGRSVPSSGAAAAGRRARDRGGGVVAHGIIT